MLVSIFNYSGTPSFIFMGQVYIIGGDGTQRGAAVIYEVILFINRNRKTKYVLHLGRMRIVAYDTCPWVTEAIHLKSVFQI